MQMMSKIGAVNLLHHIDADTVKLNYPRAGHQRSHVRVQLINPVGDEIQVPIEVRNITSDSIEITIKNRPTGIFYLRIQDGDSYIMKKIILQ
jgi:hypothetical protein